MVDDVQIAAISERLDKHILIPKFKNLKAVPNRSNGTILPYSGNNSFVFKTESNGRLFALRIFRFKRKAVISRYSYIESKIRELRSAYLHPFEFHEKGVNIEGKNYPIIVSEWLSGSNLLAAVEQAASIQPVLSRLLDVFLDLQSQRFFHGDLQPDNIFVLPNGDIKLFDFDGCYFDRISTFPPREFGSPNFTHPQRLSEKIYDDRIDDFSKWLIYLSLILVEANRIFLRYGQKDGIVFRREDFNKKDSEVLKFLGSISDRKLGHIRTFLEQNLLLVSYRDVPRFTLANLLGHDFLARPSIVSKTLAKVGTPSWLREPIEKWLSAPISISALSVAKLPPPKWMEETRPTMSASPVIGSSDGGGKPSWLQDMPKPQRPIVILRAPRSAGPQKN